MLLLILIALVPFLATVLYRPAATPSTLNDELSSTQHILVVIAHPDDECMFFAPTLLGLKSTGSDVHVLSLSTGNAEGLGQTRSVEYLSSLAILGISEGNMHILDHPDLQDNMTLNWSSEVISSEVSFYVKKFGITTILTFDHLGVSEHRNHKSAFRGVKLFTQTHVPSVKSFALISVPLVNKYSGIIGPLQTKFDLNAMRLLHFLEVIITRIIRGEEPKRVHATNDMPVFVAGVNEFLIAHKSMRAHKSQLLWFRWLYVMFSRYMWVNEWSEIVV